MPLLNDADMIYMGATEVDAVYHGSELVWENGPTIVQETVTVTKGVRENTNDDGSKTSTRYTNVGYHSGSFVGDAGLTVKDVNSVLGSRSPTTMRGYTITAAYIEWHIAEAFLSNVYGPGTASGYLHIATTANVALADLFDRVFLPGIGWIPLSSFTYDASKSNHANSYWKCSIGMASSAVEHKATSSEWASSGSTYITFEYTV